MLALPTATINDGSMAEFVPQSEHGHVILALDLESHIIRAWVKDGFQPPSL